MPRKDPRVDAYIRQAVPFARPILRHLRAIVRTGCPEVEEAIKWQFPFFDYKGPLCHMAAFKAHCAFGFWKGELIFGKGSNDRGAMGHFGRIESVADLPDEETMIGYVRKAAALNAAGVKKPERKVKESPLRIPQDFTAALRKSASARKHFESFTPAQRREYVQWILEAKRPATRQKRLATSIDWISQGKKHNWRYA